MADESKPPIVHHANPAVAFIIGLLIITLASLLNAGGLNLTKLDHVRTSSIPKYSRKKDWCRPLWVLGMLLYVASQLIGSTLALEYMRAEYVAPLGSSSLIFNFLFASWLVGTPVTSYDIYGTIIVIFGVIGIVIFGSINSGLETAFDIARIQALWGRGNWILYFIAMTLSLISLYVFVSQMEYILLSRGELASQPPSPTTNRWGPETFVGRFLIKYQFTLGWIKDTLDAWTAAKDDKTLAWTIGIAWACCGGGLAGGCLVFAKACVKLISGSLSHENTGNQFFHFASLLTFLMLATTAVFQIICLNRGLKVYDSTLVVPVFYGVYTASGFLNSLVFNNEIDAYQPWTLFLIFVSIMILISGVVLLTHKKPDARVGRRTSVSRAGSGTPKAPAGYGGDEEHGSRSSEEHSLHEVAWKIGDEEDEDEDRHEEDERARARANDVGGSRRKQYGAEGEELLTREDDLEHELEDDSHRGSDSTDRTLTGHGHRPFKDEDSEEDLLGLDRSRNRGR